MNSVCPPDFASQNARRMDSPYRSRHPSVIMSGCDQHGLPGSGGAMHGRNAGRGSPSGCWSPQQRPTSCQNGSSPDRGMAGKLNKSNTVPAPGLEPGRPSFKGWWAANYPTPDCGTICYGVVPGSQLHDTGRDPVTVSVDPLRRRGAVMLAPAQPSISRLAPEGVMERAVAHGAQDFLDLTEGLALAAQGDGLLPQAVEFLWGAHNRIFVRWSDISGAWPGQAGECGLLLVS
jgi:hypothetical protein